MAKEINYKELITRINERRANLAKAAKNLKKKFVGIDKIIDSVIENINVWYIMPELITRPTIVNLWGMTGVGKTDLIRSLVKELQFGDRFLEIQLTNKGNLFHSSIQQFLSSSAIEYDEPGILLLDEVQRFRTIDQQGMEIHDCKFQDLWMLLSDGCFSNNSGSKSGLLELLFGDSYYDQYRDEDDEELEEEDRQEAKRKKEKRKKMKYHRSYYSATQIKKKLKLSEPIEDIMQWSEEQKFTMIWNALKSDKVYEGDSYSKLLMFVSGNLDEAYDMADQTGNADQDADVFHEFSSKINIVDIKNALSKRFKPEQISRLGNVHIIYPSLSRKSYQTIIVRKVKEMTKDVNKKHGVKITVDNSVRECIYRNGVFPAQGVRPVFSSISALLGTSVPTFIMRCIEKKQREIKVSYKDEHLIALIAGKEYKYKIECSIDKIKEESNQDQIVLTSVHESGHAVVYAALFGISPTQIVSSMSSSDAGGFIGLHDITHSKMDTHNKIVCMMAGQVAEQLVFGEGYSTSGCRGDILQATKLASFYFRDWGMGEPNAKVTNQFNDHSPPGNYDMDKTNDSIEKLITKCKAEAREVIKTHIDLFTATIDKLVEYGEVKPAEFKAIGKKHGLSIKVVPPKESVLSRYGLKLAEFKDKGTNHFGNRTGLGHGDIVPKFKLAASKKKNKS